MDEIQQLEYKDFGKNLLKGTHIDIYGDDYTTDINAGKYFIHQYQELPFLYHINVQIDVKKFLGKLKKNFGVTDKNLIYKVEQVSNQDVSEIRYGGSNYFMAVKEKLFVEVSSHRVSIWYGRNSDPKEIEQLLKLAKNSKKKKGHKKKFYMIASAMHSEFGFILQDYEVKRLDVDVESNYNEDFVKVDNQISTFLAKDNTNGLVLLHGKYGTGKTTYIRSLISKIKKRFIFLPLSLIEAINAPNFLPFISQCRDSILILEDAEDLLVPRTSNSGTNNSLVNLLNLGDGLLSDALSIKIICTFNAGIKQIDPAILRKGRLVARYEFKELEVGKAKALYEKIGANGHSIEKPMTLAEVYNLNTDDYSELQKDRKVGF